MVVDGKGRLKKAPMGANKKVMVVMGGREVNLAKRGLVGRMQPRVGLIAATYWGGTFDP